MEGLNMAIPQYGGYYPQQMPQPMLQQKPQKVYGINAIISGLVICLIGALLFFNYSKFTIILIMVGIIVGLIGIASFIRNLKEDKKFAYGGVAIMVVAMIFIIYSYINVENFWGEAAKSTGENDVNVLADILKSALNYWLMSILFALLSLMLFSIAVVMTITKTVQIKKGVSIAIYVGLILAIIGMIVGYHISNQGVDGANKIVSDIIDLKISADKGKDDYMDSINTIQNGAGYGGIFSIVSFCILMFGLYQSKKIITEQQMQSQYPMQQPYSQQPYQQPQYAQQLQYIPSQQYQQPQQQYSLQSQYQQPPQYQQPQYQPQQTYQQPMQSQYQPIKVRCGKCGNILDVNAPQRPIELTCNNCGARLRVS